MSIWNKILLGLVIVASLGLFYMSARMLKIVKYWSTLAGQYETTIGNLQKEDAEKIGQIEEVRAELNKLTVDRQRVWYKCDPQVSINRQTGAVSIKVSIDQPNPSGIANKSILYAFEEASAAGPAAEKGRYLGDFKVTSVGEKQITLEPASKLLPVDLEKLAQAKRPWNLYDSLPHDNHEIFATLSEQDKKAMLPPDSVAEYIEDGQPAPKDAPARDVVDGKFVRPLRDYSLLFNDYRREITVLVDRQEAVVRDNQLLKDAQADAQAQVKYYQDQTVVVGDLLAKISAQRDAVKAYLDKLQEKIAEVKANIQKYVQENKAMAGQLAKLQLDATRRIDERTRSMAQSANGEN
jgi:hypothetical protein